MPSQSLKRHSCKLLAGPERRKLPSCTSNLHPGRLTAGTCPHRGLVQIIFLSKWVICMFHVNLPGCMDVCYFVFLQQRREGFFCEHLIEICTKILLVGLGYIPVPINQVY